MKFFKKLKEIYKKGTFLEYIKMIDNGVLFMRYEGDNLYRGYILDIELDSEFTCTDEGSYDKVKQELRDLPWDYPLHTKV